MYEWFEKTWPEVNTVVDPICVLMTSRLVNDCRVKSGLRCVTFIFCVSFIAQDMKVTQEIVSSGYGGDQRKRDQRERSLTIISRRSNGCPQASTSHPML